jgi:hypothetical protein
METKQDIEDQINRAIESVKNIQPVELPLGFSDRVIVKMHAQPARVRTMYAISPLLKIAAVFILILINVFTLRLALSPQPMQTPAQYGTIKDFVNDYQVNDANLDLLTINTPAHE